MSDEERTADAARGDTEEVTDAEVTTTEPAADHDLAEDADHDVVATEELTGDATPAGKSGRRVRGKVGALLLAVALLASAGLAGWLYVNQYRPDKETDPAATRVALDAATSGTIALLSYSPESLDRDFAAAKARLTGDFLNYYTQFTEQIVTPAAKEKSVKTAASVVRAAVANMAPDSAEVLVFINQTTTSKENPDGAFAASSVKVGLKKIDGAWLIGSFDPV